jgi:hypothetical protein
MDQDAFSTVAGMIVRHGLTTLGGALAGAGVVNGEAGVTQFVGAGMVIFGIALSWWNKKGQAQVAALLKKVTNRDTTVAAVNVAQAVPQGSAVTPGLPAKPL